MFNNKEFNLKDPKELKYYACRILQLNKSNNKQNKENVDPNFEESFQYEIFLNLVFYFNLCCQKAGYF